MKPDPARLTLAEQIAWLRIVQTETHAGPRRLIARWAQPGDLHPCTRRLLDDTLRRMWRSPTGE